MYSQYTPKMTEIREYALGLLPALFAEYKEMKKAVNKKKRAIFLVVHHPNGYFRIHHVYNKKQLGVGSHFEAWDSTLEFSIQWFAAVHDYKTAIVKLYYTDNLPDDLGEGITDSTHYSCRPSPELKALEKKMHDHVVSTEQYNDHHQR